jgi:glyoxylase-like metal-dependent hydrolase (beta-lactamase superfamily II)
LDVEEKMIFKQIESGGDRNYAYIIGSEKTREAAVTDPSPDPSGVIKEIRQEKLKIRYLINTHSHFDHSGGNDYFKKSESGSEIIFINCSEETMASDGKVFNLGDIKLEFLSTPGHTPDSVCIKAGNKLITGDTLFVGKVGGTYGEMQAKTEFESLKKIMALPPDTEIWPGHNYGVKTSSTIKFELENNPFIQRLADFGEFLHLKETWAAYKQEHGIK